MHGCCAEAGSGGEDLGRGAEHAPLWCGGRSGANSGGLKHGSCADLQGGPTGTDGVERLTSPGVSLPTSASVVLCSKVSSCCCIKTTKH